MDCACNSWLVVKLRFRSRSGESKVRVRKVRVRSESCELGELKHNLKELDLSYTINLVFTTTKQTSSWLLRGLDKSDGQAPDDLDPKLGLLLAPVTVQPVFSHMTFLETLFILS